MTDLWGTVAPRAWQAEALPLVLQALRRRERGIVSAIMGSGKSVLIAKICASGRGRVLVTVPTIALVEQLAETISGQVSEPVGRYYTHAKEPTARVVIACLPSVPALVRDPSWPGPPALWIADEAHRTEASTILDTYEALRPDRAVGFTATPFRASEAEDLSLWDREIYAYGVAQALSDGVIVPFRVEQWEGPDDTPLDEACIAMIAASASAGPGIVNASSVDDAEAFSDRLGAAGISCAPIHSRMPRDEISRTLDRLRTGRLRAVCHVNMLSEGVDFPWLRWLCLRRVVKSRVRFCQEVGRVLRSSPGKSEAVILDPSDLFGSFALSYEAILSGMAARPETEAEFGEELLAAEKAAKAADEMGGGGGPVSYPALMKAWHRYLRRLYLAAVCVGAIDPRVKTSRWRTYPATSRQVAMVGKLAGGMSRDTGIPLPHRKMLAAIGEAAGNLSRGDVSDLISLGFLFRGARGRGGDGTAGLWRRMAGD